jgi:hypothetical protein
MIDAVEEFPYVRFNHPYILPANLFLKRFDCLPRGKMRPLGKTTVEKQRLEQSFQYSARQILNDFIFQRRNTQRSLSAIALGNEHSAVADPYRIKTSILSVPGCRLHIENSHSIKRRQAWLGRTNVHHSEHKNEALIE